jgi:hypothetical protein
MSSLILRTTLVACVVTFSVSAFAQAAAEAALSHAAATSMGTAAGKALGQATNQMTNRVAGKLGQQTPNAAQRSAVTKVRAPVQSQTEVEPTTTAEPPAGGSMIQSIQGAAPQAACTTYTPADSKAAANPAGQKNGCPAPPQNGNTHPSMITLPPAK